MRTIARARAFFGVVVVVVVVVVDDYSDLLLLLVGGGEKKGARVFYEYLCVCGIRCSHDASRDTRTRVCVCARVTHRTPPKGVFFFFFFFRA